MEKQTIKIEEETNKKTLDDLFFDFCPWLYRFLYRVFDFHSHKCKLIRFWQRRTRGWDDSETWDLDHQFYLWLEPRLKRFREVNIGFPGNEEYPTFESWDRELDFRYKQLCRLIELDYKEDDVTEKEIEKYVSKEEIKNIKEKAKQFGSNSTLIHLQITAVNNMEKDFDTWFCKSRRQLWW